MLSTDATAAHAHAPSLSSANTSPVSIPYASVGVESGEAGREVGVKPGFLMIATTHVLFSNEMRDAVRAPVSHDGEFADDTISEAHDQKQSLGEQTNPSEDWVLVGDTAASRSKAKSACSLKTPDDVQQRIREMRLGKRRRQREQQKDELKHLALRVEELNTHLTRLRQHQSEFTQQTLVAANKLNVIPADAVSAKRIWQQLTSVEEEQLRTSLMENTRLRAQYECQLQIANGLKRLYENKDSFTVSDMSLESLLLYIARPQL